MNIKRRFEAAMMALLLSFGAAFSQNKAIGTGKEDDSHLIDAVEMVDDGKYQEALSVLKGILDVYPDNDAALYYSGICNLYLHNIKDAQTDLKKASVLDSKNYWYKERLAMAYAASGEDDLTIATYEELLKDFPKKNDLYFSLVNLYLKQNQFDKALEAMDQIEAVFGKSENVTSTRYDILLRQNKPQEALKALMDYNKDFSSPRILSQIGDYSMAEYKDSAALTYYQEALDLQSNYIPALLGKTEVFRMRRDYPDFFSTLNEFVSDDETDPQAKTQYLNMLLNRSEARFIQNFKPQLDSLVDKLVAHHPQDSSALITSGMYYFSTERHQKAKNLIGRNRDLHPESVTANATYAQLLGYMEDWDGVIEASEKALKSFPEETGFLDLENSAFYNKKDYEGIVGNCNRVLGLFPDDTSKTIPALATLGDMYYELGRKEEAFKAYEKALKLNPDYAPVLNNYAYYLSIKGKKLKKAYEMSRKTIEKEPDNSTYLDTIGWILHLQGKDQEAKAHFKHAMLYGGKESATCLRHYATVLEALGETELSKVYRMQADSKEAEGKE